MALGLAKELFLSISDKAYAVPVVHRGKLVIWVPRSIAFAKLDHHEACRLFDAVAVVIEQETGLRDEELLREG